MRLLLAGTTGVIGQQLVRLLAAVGHTVTRTTRALTRTPAILTASAPAVL
jgi:NAD dependent epimerase/dehydratase family enzyme